MKLLSIITLHSFVCSSMAVLRGQGRELNVGEVTNLVLIDADTDLPIAAGNPLVENDVIYLNGVPAKLSIEAVFTGVVDSLKFVVFSSTDDKIYEKIENRARFSLCGNNADDFNRCRVLIPGCFKVEATTFSSNDAMGDQGPTFTVNFCINAGSAVEGDPHFTLWSGEKYDYHGQCDLVIIQDPFFADGLGLELQARTTLVFGQYSFIEEAAVKIGQDKFYLHSLGEFAINGMKGDQVNVTDSTFGGFPFSHWHSGKVYYHRFLIHLDNQGAKIELKAFENIIYISASGGAKKFFHKSNGMLGDGNDGRMVGRDGETMYEDPVELAGEWQVRDTDAKLFEVSRPPQYPEKCVVPGATKLRISSPVSRERAEEACAEWNVDKEQCIFDVMATGNIGIAMLKDVDKEANAAEAQQ